MISRPLGKGGHILCVSFCTRCEVRNKKANKWNFVPWGMMSCYNNCDHETGLSQSSQESRWGKIMCKAAIVGKAERKGKYLGY